MIHQLTMAIKKNFKETYAILTGGTENHIHGLIVKKIYMN